jgi:hypothetical protein
VATTITLLLLWWVVGHKQFVAGANALGVFRSTCGTKRTPSIKRNNAGCQVYLQVNLT